MSVTLGSPPGGVNSFLIECTNFLTVFVSVTLGSPRGGVNNFLIHCTNFLTVFVLVTFGSPPGGANRFAVISHDPTTFRPSGFPPRFGFHHIDFRPQARSCVLRQIYSQCKPNVGRSKPPHPLNQCCFNAECWIWLLSALRCRGHHTYPAKPAFVGNVDYEGCRGDLLCFKAGERFLGPSAQGRRNVRVKAVCNDHAGGPSMWFSGLVYLSGSKSALKTCFRCCSNLLLGSKPSLNNKNDICELIELLCASRAGTCSRRPGQSLWRRLRWRGTLRVEHLPRSIFWDQKMDPKMGPPY